MAYIKRAAEDTITQISKMFPVLLVTGPRQVGKTTLLQRLAEAQRTIKTLLYLFAPEQLCAVEKVKNVAILRLIYDEGKFHF